MPRKPMHPKRVFEKIRKAFTPKSRKPKRKRARKYTDSEVSGSGPAPPSSSLQDPNLPAYAPLPTHNVPKQSKQTGEQYYLEHVHQAARNPPSKKLPVWSPFPHTPAKHTGIYKLDHAIIESKKNRPPIWLQLSQGMNPEPMGGSVPGRDDDDVSVDEDPYWLM